MSNTSKIMIAIAALAVAGCDALPVGEAGKAKEEVKQMFVDPASARISDFGRCPADKEMWRGKADGKNRMGAYTGEEPFFYKNGVFTPVEDRRFLKVMNECYGSEEKVWSSFDTVNQIDDSKTVVAVADADVDLSSGSDKTVSIRIRCMSGETEMYIEWNDYLGDDSHDVYDEWKHVTVRVGKEKARKERWGISTDNDSTFAPGSPIALIRKMATADQVVFNTTPYAERPVTAVFKLDGFRQAVAPVAKQCGWTL